MSSSELVQIAQSSRGVAFEVKRKPPQLLCFKTFAQERLEAYAKAENHAKEKKCARVQWSEYHVRAEMIHSQNRRKIEICSRVRLERQMVLVRKKRQLELRLEMTARRREEELLQKKAAASKDLETVRAKLSLYHEQLATGLTLFGTGPALVPIHKVRIGKARIQNQQRRMVAKQVLREKQLTAAHERRISLRKMERAARQRDEEVEKKRLRAYHHCHAVQAKLLMFQERMLAAAGALRLSLQCKQSRHRALREALLANRCRLAAKRNGTVLQKTQLRQWILIDQSTPGYVPSSGACSVFEAPCNLLEVAKSRWGVAFEVKTEPLEMGQKTSAQERLEAYGHMEIHLQQGTKAGIQQSVYCARAEKIHLQNRQKSEVVSRVRLERQKDLAQKKCRSELRMGLASAKRDRELAQKKATAAKYNRKVGEKASETLHLWPICMTPVGSLARAVQERADKARENNHHKHDVLKRVQCLQETVKVEKQCRLEHRMQTVAERRKDELNRKQMAAAKHLAAVKAQLATQQDRKTALASAAKTFLICKNTNADSLRGALLAQRSQHAKRHNENVWNKLNKSYQLETDLENLHLLIMQEHEPLVRQTVYQGRADRARALNLQKCGKVKQVRSQVAGMLVEKQRRLQQRMQKAAEKREIHLTDRKTAGPRPFVLVKARTLPSLRSCFERAMHVAFGTRKEFERAPVCPDSHLMHLNLFTYQMHAARASVYVGAKTKI